MPRDVGTGLYHYPEGTLGIPGQTVFSARYNTFLNDLTNTLNSPIPIVFGGTGADNPTTARDNLDAEVAGTEVTNYATHVWELGSFWSATSATGEPVDGQAFGGIVYGKKGATAAEDVLMMEARSQTDGRKFVRFKLAGAAWSAWVAEDSDYVNVAGDTMTGHLGLPVGPAAHQAVRKDLLDLTTTTANNALAAANNRVLRAGDIMTGNLQAPALIATSGITAGGTISSSSAAGSSSQSTGAITASQGGIGCHGLWVGVSAPAQAYATTLGGVTGFGCWLAVGFSNAGGYHGVSIKDFTSGGLGTYMSFIRDDGLTKGTIVGNAATTVAYNTSSDERLKQNIKDATEVVDIKAAIMGTRVVHFAWKSNPEIKQIGLLGQQAAGFMKEIVTPPQPVMRRDEETKKETPDKTPWMIDYGKATPYLLAGLQEAWKIIDALEARLAALEAAQATP